MKILTWNVRGLESARKICIIKEALRVAKADIVMLQETKLEVVDNKWVRSIWGIRNKEWSFLPSIGALGGHIIIWKEDMFECIDLLFGAFLCPSK